MFRLIFKKSFFVQNGPNKINVISISYIFDIIEIFLGQKR
jgi:hypothetical protein